jgi:hypothetical protein
MLMIIGGGGGGAIWKTGTDRNAHRQISHSKKR